jgi:predicted amidophosphoribosyltransferase
MPHRAADRVGEALRGVVDLVLPGSCAACGLPAPRALCPTCRADLRTPGPGPSALADGTPCWSALPFDGAVRRSVSAYKDGDRRDLADVLAPVLATALGRACSEDPVLRRARSRGDPVLAVPVPPAGRARRHRGDDPVGSLVRRAVTALGDDSVVVADVLGHRRRVGDQARLGRAARWANLAGALRVVPGGGAAVRGAACLVVDDVVTTGATLGEAARALRGAGGGHVAAATLAATTRHVTGRSLVSHRSGG